MKVVIMFLSFYLWAQFFPCSLSAQTPIQKEPEKATLQILLDFTEAGEVALEVRKHNLGRYEPEEMARLLSNWFCKILYMLQSRIPRMFLVNEVQKALWEPKLKPGDNVLRKAEIDDALKLIDKVKKEKVASSIKLYLQELANDNRGLVSYLSGDVTEQQMVFSWVVILQYATQNYSAEDINLIHDIMGETIKAYSGGADPDVLENIIIIPNDAFLRIKMRE